jgi:hypothetical protein
MFGVGFFKVKRNDSGVGLSVYLILFGVLFASTGFSKVSTDTSSWQFPIIGIAISLIGVFLLVRSLIRARNIKNLIRTGQKLQGVLIDVQTTQDNHKRNTYQIVVSATDSMGVVQNYVSDRLNSIGGLAMMDPRTNPIPIDVYVDATNPQNYYVDISDIPNLTPERIIELLQTAAKTAQPQTIYPQQSTPPITETAQIPNV